MRGLVSSECTYIDDILSVLRGHPYSTYAKNTYFHTLPSPLLHLYLFGPPFPYVYLQMSSLFIGYVGRFLLIGCVGIVYFSMKNVN